jgi:hypothetical protein
MLPPLRLAIRLKFSRDLLMPSRDSSCGRNHFKHARDLIRRQRFYQKLTHRVFFIFHSAIPIIPFRWHSRANLFRIYIFGGL